jgi:hypothetical protein
MATFGQSPANPFKPPKSPAPPPTNQSPSGGTPSSYDRGTGTITPAPRGGGGGGSSGGGTTLPLDPTPIYDERGILVGINDPKQQKTLLPTPSDYLKYGGAPPQKSSAVASDFGTKPQAFGSPVGGTGAVMGEVGVIPPIDTSILTRTQKAKYFYEQADSRFGGYLPSAITPKEFKDRRDAQKKAEQYQELLEKKSFWDIADTGKFTTKEFVFGSTYDKDVVLKSAVAQTEIDLKKDFEQVIIPEIKKEGSNYENTFNDIQDKLNRGEITEDMAKSWNERAYKDYKEKSEKIQKDWEKDYANPLIKDREKTLRQIDSAYNLKSVTAPKIALVAGATALTGGVAGALVAKGAIGAGAISTAGILGAGAIGISAGLTTESLLQTRKEQGGELEFHQIASAFTPVITYSAVGLAGGLAGARLGSSAVTRARINKTNIKASEFTKELRNNPVEMKKYFTPENLKKGSFEKTIDGVKYKFSITEADRVRLAQALEGTKVVQKTGSVGVELKGDVKTQLLGKLGLDKSYSISEVSTKQYTAITGQQIGRGNKAYIVTEGSSLNRAGYIVQITDTGKIIRPVALRQEIDPSKGTSLLITKKVDTNILRTKKDGFIFEGLVTKGKPSFYLAKAQTQEIIPLGTRGDASLIRSKIAVGKVKGTELIRGDSERIFGKDRELVSEFFSRKALYKIDPKGFKPEKVGFSDRLVSTRRGENELIKLRRDLFAEGTRVETFKPPVLFDKVKPIRTPKTTPEQPIPQVKSPTPTSSLLPKNIRIREPSRVPDREFPSIVQEGGKGQSLYGFDSSSSLLNRQQNVISALSDAPAFLAQAPRAGTIKLPFQAEVGRSPSARLLFADGSRVGTDFDSRVGFLAPDLRVGQKRELTTPVIERETRKAQVSSIGLGLLSGTATASVVGSGVKLGARQDIRLAQPLQQQPIQPLKLPFGFRTGLIPPTGVGLPFGFRGDVKVGGGERARPRGTPLFKSTTYTASLGSVLLRAPKKKVTREELKRLGKQRFTGLGLRPEIEIDEGNGKKRKKRLGLF